MLSLLNRAIYTGNDGKAAGSHKENKRWWEWKPNSQIIHQLLTCNMANRICLWGLTPAPWNCARMPRQFLGICGVYDLARHYEYEKRRGVHWLSTMERVMGGQEGLTKFSPLSMIQRSPSPGTIVDRRDMSIARIPSTEHSLSASDWIGLTSGSIHLVLYHDPASIFGCRQISMR